MIAAALAAFVLVPLAIWGATSLGGEDDTELAVDPYPGTQGAGELVVSLPDEELNTPETSDGELTVGLECLDAEGEVLFRVEHRFPFTDTDEGTQLPHIHQPVSREQFVAAETCRLDGTDPALEGSVDELSDDAPPPVSEP